MPEFGGKRSMAQMQGWMVKAQQSEVVAREEARRFQAQLEPRTLGGEALGGARVRAARAGGVPQPA